MTASELPAAVENHIGELTRAFQKQALVDAKILRAHADDLLSASGCAARHAALIALRDLAHRLAGRGGTFGFPAISTAASTVELAVEDVLPRISTAPPDALAHLRSLTVLLREEIAALAD